MKTRKRYRKKAEHYVVAVQLKLETEGFTYHKWGAEQCCQAGDWLVDNGGDIYTVDQNVFAATYHQVDPGRFIKTTFIWAEIATEAGVLETKEGQTHYQAGDYLVSNNEDGSDSYCVPAQKFESIFTPDE